MTKFTKAYFAGLFDGEGYVGLYSNSKRTEAVRVIIGQATDIILRELKDNWGGSVYARFDKRNNRTHFAWEIRARKAERFLKDIYPFIRIKRRQVDLALEAINLDYDGKLAIKMQIKLLNAPMGFGKAKEVYHY